MFYEKQPETQRNNYKNMLKIVGSLSRLFSTAKEPYLYYRAHENIFSKYFDVKNNARSDDSADAYSSNGIGIGLKTWVGQDNQKVAEFGRLKTQYEQLSGMDLINKIAEYRNKRITATMNAHGLKQMLYHIVKREPGKMCIYESAFDKIDISNIVLDIERGNENSTYFSDGKHTYHFSTSKNTLYMNFDDMELLDKFDVEIDEDPYALLASLMSKETKKDTVDLMIPFIPSIAPKKEQLCLRLYSTNSDGSKFVAEHSGLNQWNGSRKVYTRNSLNGERKMIKNIPRNPNELYIPYPAEDRIRKEFFPSKDVAFDLLLPDGQWISAKVCQQDSKAIMSNPNSCLGKWLLRDVLELEEGTKVTYDMLREFNIDCVIFTKLSSRKYSVDFGSLGTYERFYGLDDLEAE